MLLSPSRGKPSSASGFPRAGLSLHIISHHPDTISPDQSPSKDPRELEAAGEEAPLPSPDPIIIHSQAPLTPDGSPLTGPPPYQPPETHEGVTAEEEEVTPQRAESPNSTDESSLAPRSVEQCKIPRTLSAPAAASALSLDQSESLSAAERAEDRYLVQLLEQASALTTNRSLNQDCSEASEETQPTDAS